MKLILIPVLYLVSLFTDVASSKIIPTMKIKVGDKTFTSTLSDNPTAVAFRSLLPMHLKMIELNGNEKYAELVNSLPVNASTPGTIKSGDIMLYGSSTLVLFYKSFSSSYSYTRIGRIDDPAGLEAALGWGDISVSFEVK